MLRTRVGYAGGTHPNPTYHDLGDHTETFQVDYDPAKISYEKLLDLFWDSHSPCSRTGFRQYMSAVFTMNEDQRRRATESKARLEKSLGRSVATPILPLDRFYLAEDYHQKYSLRNSPLMSEFQAIYPDPAAVTASTAAARVNGYLSGDGTAAQLKGEIDRLGLSAEGRKALLREVGER